MFISPHNPQSTGHTLALSPSAASQAVVQTSHHIISQNCSTWAFCPASNAPHDFSGIPVNGFTDSVSAHIDATEEF